MIPGPARPGRFAAAAAVGPRWAPIVEATPSSVARARTPQQAMHVAGHASQQLNSPRYGYRHSESPQSQMRALRLDPTLAPRQVTPIATIGPAEDIVRSRRCAHCGCCGCGCCRGQAVPSSSKALSEVIRRNATFSELPLRQSQRHDSASKPLIVVGDCSAAASAPSTPPQSGFGAAISAPSTPPQARRSPRLATSSPGLRHLDKAHLLASPVTPCRVAGSQEVMTSTVAADAARSSLLRNDVPRSSQWVASTEALDAVISHPIAPTMGYAWARSSQVEAPSRLQAAKEMNAEMMSAASANIELLARAVAEAEVVARQAIAREEKATDFLLPQRLGGCTNEVARREPLMGIEPAALQYSSLGAQHRAASEAGVIAPADPRRGATSTSQQERALSPEDELLLCSAQLSGRGVRIHEQGLMAASEGYRRPAPKSAEPCAHAFPELSKPSLQSGQSSCARGIGSAEDVAETRHASECSRLRDQLEEAERRAENDRRVWSEEREELLSALRAARADTVVQAQHGSGVDSALPAERVRKHLQQAAKDGCQEVEANAAAPLGVLPTFGGGGDMPVGDVEGTPYEPELDRLKRNLRAAMETIVHLDRAQDSQPYNVAGWSAPAHNAVCLEGSQLDKSTALGGGAVRSSASSFYSIEQKLGFPRALDNLGPAGGDVGRCPTSCTGTLQPKLLDVTAPPGEAVSIVKSELEKLRSWYQSRKQSES